MTQGTNNKTINHFVGAIVVSAVIVILIMIVLSSSGVSFQRYTFYRVYMQESVTGLSPDSAVEYNGVDVGTVKEIEIDQNNPHFVKLLLSIKNSTLVTVDTVATLRSKGLTGISFVSLSLKGDDLSPLVPQPGEPYAIIPTTPSFFMQLDAMITHMNTIIGNVKASFQELLNKDDLETMRETYYSIDHLITVLKNNPGDFSAIVANTQNAIVSFRQIKLYKDNISQIIEIRISPFGYELIDKFAAVFSTLADATLVIKDHPSALLFGVERPVGGSGEANAGYLKKTCDAEKIPSTKVCSKETRGHTAGC